MASINVVVIAGNLTRDPESHDVGDTTVCNFGIAQNDVWYDDDDEKQEKAHFFDVECWGNQADNAMKYLEKGREVTIQGSLKYNEWEDEETGETRSRVTIRAFKIKYGSSKNDENGNGKRKSSKSKKNTDSDDSGGGDWFNEEDDDGVDL